MTPFYVAPGNRIALAALPVVALAVGAGMLFHPVSLAALGFGSHGNATPSPAPAAYTAPASSTVFLSKDAAASAAAAQTAGTPMQEVHIANNGMTLLRGARVTSVSNGTITVTLSWGGADFTWSAHSAYGTEFYDGKGNKSSIDSIRVGDIVSITGQLQQTTGAPSVTAQYIHDQSI